MSVNPYNGERMAQARPNFPPIEFSPTKESFQETYRVTAATPFYILVQLSRKC